MDDKVYEVINELPEINEDVFFKGRWTGMWNKATYTENGFVDMNGKIWCQFLDSSEWTRSEESKNKKEDLIMR